MWSCVDRVEEEIDKLRRMPLVWRCMIMCRSYGVRIWQTRENAPSLEMCGRSLGERLEWSQRKSVSGLNFLRQFIFPRKIWLVFRPFINFFFFRSNFCLGHPFGFSTYWAFFFFFISNGRDNFMSWASKTSRRALFIGCNIGRVWTVKKKDIQAQIPQLYP